MKESEFRSRDDRDTEKIRHVREDEYARMMRENQRMAQLLEKIMQVCIRGENIVNHHGLMSAIERTIFDVNNPPVPEYDISSGKFRTYTQVMQDSAKRSGCKIGGMDILMIENTAMPDNEMWLTYKGMALLKIVLDDKTPYGT